MYLSTVTQVLQIIWLIILILIFLYLFAPVLWGNISDNWNKSNPEHKRDHELLEEQDKESEESLESKNNPKQINFNYESYSQELRLETIKSHDESIDHDQFNYQDLLKIYHHPQFLKNYQAALNISFDDKLKIYHQIHKQKLQDIRECESKYESNSTVYLQHDTTLERLRREKNEIERILNILKYRKQNNQLAKIERNFELMLFNQSNGFASLVGREDIKDYLALKIYTFSQNPKIFFTNYQNMILTGKSGIGKTKLGETIGYIYAKSGILARNKFRVVTAQDLTSKYVNDSGQVTREILLSCLEGFLMIDEAYELGNNNKMFFNHNSQATTELVNLLSLYKGLSVVAAAGYKKDMEQFKEANKGIKRRFPDELYLRSYSSKELTDILIMSIYKSAPDISIDQKDANTLYTMIKYIYETDKKIFDKQAGDMENLSSHITRAIYGNNRRTWIAGKTKNNSHLIVNGMKSYLRTKGVVLKI